MRLGLDVQIASNWVKMRFKMTESIVCCEWRLFKWSHVSPWFFRLSLGSSRQQGSLGPS